MISIILFFIIFISEAVYSQTLINGNFDDWSSGWQFENSFLIINSPYNMTSPSLRLLTNSNAIGTVFNMKNGYYSVNMSLYTYNVINRKDSGIYCKFSCESGESEIFSPTMDYFLFQYDDTESNLIISSTEYIIIDDISVNYHGTQNPNDITPEPTQEITPTQQITPTITTTNTITETPQTVTPTTTETATCTALQTVKYVLVYTVPNTITFDQTANIKVYGLDKDYNRIDIENFILNCNHGTIRKVGNNYVYYPNQNMGQHYDFINVNYNDISGDCKIKIIKNRIEENEQYNNNPIGGRGPIRSAVLSLILN